MLNLAVTAFKSNSVDDVARAITDYVKSHGVSCESVAIEPEPKGKYEAFVFSPVNGWTVVCWPSWFYTYDFPFARTLAASQGWLVSSIHIFDDEACWEHLCCSGRAELHAFCSRPHILAELSPAYFQRALRYNSEPSRLASAVGISPLVIQPYLVDLDSLTTPEAKAHHDDEFTLEDCWVIVDFWRRVGITYPCPEAKLAAALRFGVNFSEKLPVD